MGKRGQRNNIKKSGPVAAMDPVLAAALEAGSGGMFRALAPNKRHELNGLVEKLLNLTSNFAVDAPSSPNGLYEEHLEIRKLLEPILDMEKCNLNRRLLGSRLGHVKELVEWVEKHGGEVKGVTVHDYKEQGLGLRVEEDLCEGDVVFKIPRKVLMSVDTAKDSEIGRLIEKDPMLQTMNNVTLALHLLLEKTSPASFWEPYINCLPTRYNTVLYYEPKDFQELKGSPAFEDSLKQFKFVARQYAYFYRKFQQTILKDYFTFDEYRWAVSTVMTRQNQVPALDEKSPPINALIPLWDMANHSNGKVSTDYDDTNHTIKCMANRNFKSNEEFTIFYGARPNHVLLVHNGFTYRDNKHNSLVIKLGISKNDQLSTLKNDLLAKLGISPHGHFALRLNGEERPFDPTLLAFLRAMCLSDKAAVDRWDESEKTQDLLNDEIEEKELDKKAHQYLLTRCSLLLKSYPTTLEEDVEIRDKQDLKQFLKDCLELRIGEKQILNGTIKYCQSKV